MRAMVRWSLACAATALAVLGACASPASAAAVSEFSVPSPSGDIAAGPDGALWFPHERVGPNGQLLEGIGRITTQGVFTDFPFANDPSLTRNVTGIVAGPDDALWFTEEGNRIGRITTDGKVTEFPIPTRFSGPTDITVGPDGALWFTEQQSGKIGRITTAGTVTEFPFTAGSITAGPDGALWFTGIAGNIGRLTTSGDVTEFPLQANTNAFSLVTGPDGALWFTEGEITEGGSKIGRMTTAGVVTEFALSPNSNPAAIAAGPDGALWFTEFGMCGPEEEDPCGIGAGIGRITTDGVITEFPNRTMDIPRGITAGSDGAMWFTERNGQKIGRITTDVGLAAPRASMKVRPRSGCASSAVTVTVKATGDAKLSRLVLLLDGRRLVRTKRRRFQVRVNVRRLDPGVHRLKAVALGKAGGRAAKTRTFQRCAEPGFTG